MYTNGVSLTDICNHVYKTLNLKVGKDTLHRLLKPIRRGTTASRRFKSFIDACVLPKRNSGEKRIHRDYHYTCSQVHLVNEMTKYSPHGTVSFSVDNKNKGQVGNPATSRREYFI